MFLRCLQTAEVDWYRCQGNEFIILYCIAAQAQVSACCLKVWQEMLKDLCGIHVLEEKKVGRKAEREISYSCVC